MNLFNWMNCDSFIHPWNHSHNQDIEHFHYFQNISVPLFSLLFSYCSKIYISWHFPLWLLLGVQSSGIKCITLFCHHYHCPSPELSFHPKPKLWTHWMITPHSPFAPASGNHHSTSSLSDFDSSRHFYGLNHTIFALSCLAYFTYLAECFKGLFRL